MGPPAPDRAASGTSPSRVASKIAAEIGSRLRAAAPHDAASLHRVRRQLSKELEDHEAQLVIAIAHRLVAARGVPGARMIACAVVGHHSGALAELGVSQLERLGHGLASWGDVDVFACLVAGRAWRAGVIQASTVHRWARSRDRWWRRAALVCTVPLNVRSQGGTGDTARTLAVCKILVADHDDMVVKGMSWALRELITHDRQAVATFLTRHERVLAARVRREVLSKVQTGLKTPKGRQRRPSPRGVGSAR